MNNDNPERILLPDQSSPLSGTGERLLPGHQGSLRAEHFHRYLVAHRFVSGLDVLDIACGEGYGSYIIGQAAKSVIGVDIAAEVVAAAVAKYDNCPKLRFLQGDCAHIPVPSASVDVVVSFETIEHLADHDAFLREIKRILRPDGFLIISSPNKLLYNYYDNKPNEFHISEVDESDFKNKLSEYFPSLNSCSQQYLGGSFISPAPSTQENLQPLIFEQDELSHIRPVDHLKNLKYSIYLAGNAQLPQVPLSFFPGDIRDQRSGVFKTPPLMLKVQLYHSPNSMFSEEASISKRIDSHTRSITFSLQDPSARMLRFDPCEQYGIVRLSRISAQDKRGLNVTVEVSGSNALLTENTDYFFADDDPQILLVCSAPVSKISFEVDYLALESDADFRLLPLAMNVLKQFTGTAASPLPDEVSAAIQREFSEYLLAANKSTIRRLRDNIALLEAAFAHPSGNVSTGVRPSDNSAVQELAELKPVLADLDNENSSLRDELHRIKGSVSWRMIDRLRRFVYGLPGARRLATRVRRALISREHKKSMRVIRASGLFDAAYYLESNPDLAESRMDPLEHFMVTGSQEGRRPNPDFDPHYYLQMRPDCRSAGINPLYHYIRFGRDEMQGVATAPDGNTALNIQRADESPASAHLFRGTIAHDHGFSDGTYERSVTASSLSSDIKLIAFYLPQFHPIPENDAWWGKGFTEWTNVTKARPLFPDHHQPKLPSDLGFYDLRIVDIQRQQAQMAREHGIHGFCYYYYWFGGHKLLQQPLEQMLAHPEIELPFCLCWANENWSRRWDGLEEDVLIAQKHSADEDIRFIEDLYAALDDTRYIHIDGKPLLIIYRPDLLPNAAESVSRWRQHFRDSGRGELYLAMVQTAFGQTDPRPYGFDAAIEFPPHQSVAGEVGASVPGLAREFGGKIFSYADMAENSSRKKWAPYTWFRGIIPGWDNTARRGAKAHIFHGATPSRFSAWLNRLIADSRKHLPEDRRFIFINAWNEWAEGAYLEPDTRTGYAYLNRTLAAIAADTTLPRPAQSPANRLQTHAYLEPISSGEPGPHFEGTPVTVKSAGNLKYIALYLPQFHPIPENDLWWGKGFTEWANVTRTLPHFSGHIQPNLPGELGFYDLRYPGVQERQVELARNAGLHGFCMFYYWFNGKRVLDAPLLAWRENSGLDFPYCFCWANENWTRRWDGYDAEILLKQDYRNWDESAFIDSLIPWFRDPRYIRIDGKPVLLIYKASSIPNARQVAQRWRQRCEQEGFPGLYLVMCQTFGDMDPREFDFDAAMEYPPHNIACDQINSRVKPFNPRFSGSVFAYDEMAERYTAQKQGAYPVFRGVMTRWDNSARRPDPNIWHGAIPDAYGRWLKAASESARRTLPEDRRFVFINAWNEWAESAYLEPDRHFGYAYLNTTARTLEPELTVSIGPEPSISVVMPVYNGGSLLELALDSVAAQTLPPKEIVIVNDGSTDDSPQRIEAWSAKHPGTPLRIITQENRGAHAAINRGVEKSSGDWIAVINQDDLYHPRRLEELSRAVARERTLFAFSDLAFIDADGASAEDTAHARTLRALIGTLTTDPSPLHALLKGNYSITTGNHFFARQLHEQLGGYRDLKYCHDWDFFLGAQLLTKPLFVPQQLYRYRLHDKNSFHALQDVADRESKMVLSRFYQQLRERPDIITSCFGDQEAFRSYVKRIGQADIAYR